MPRRDPRPGHGSVYKPSVLSAVHGSLMIGTDIKATALLKLIYLEMMGHDMSWASFNVLEVMSSPKYHQKRIGYLGAVQSYRPDTEVLMLATNLLKKVCAKSGLLQQYAPTRLTTAFVGPHLRHHKYDIPTDTRPAPFHHAVAGALHPGRPSSATHTHEPVNTQEDNSHIVQTSPGISRNTKGSMAEDQGTSDGTG